MDEQCTWSLTRARRKHTDNQTNEKPARISRKEAHKIFRLQKERKNLFKGHGTLPLYRSDSELCSLSRIPLKDLRINVRAFGCYILLRSLDVYQSETPPIIRLLVEDHTGEFSFCEIYFHVFVSLSKKADDEFPFGTMFIIKEPFLKYEDGILGVVVTSPGDFLRVTRNDVLIEETARLGWISSVMHPKTALEWKEEGNDMFKAGDYFEATVAYLMGLQSPCSAKVELLLRLNLAGTYLLLGFYESCLKYAVEVLDLDHLNEKALYRSGRASYELGLFEKAQILFKKLLLLSNPHNKKAMLESTKCEKRLSESKGNIDIHDLCLLTKDSPWQTVDFGTYLGPVKVVMTRDNGYCIVACTDVKPGTLILAEKAYVAELFALDNTEDRLKMNWVMMFQKFQAASYLNPDNSEQVLELFPGTRIPFYEEHKAGLYMMDIIEDKSFTFTSRADSHRMDKLFCKTASQISHSCFCNSSYENYNDVILVRTLTYVRKGEQITVDFNSGMRSYMETPFQGCFCDYCNAIIQDGREVRRKLEVLTEKYQRIVGIMPGAIPPRFSKPASERRLVAGLVRDLEEAYQNRQVYKTSLFYPYLYLAETLNKKDGNFKEQVLEYANKALSCLGLSSLLLLSCSEGNRASLPKDALIARSDRLFSVAKVILLAQTTIQDTIKWYRVLIMLENLFTGGDYKMLTKRLPDKELFPL